MDLSNDVLYTLDNYFIFLSNTGYYSYKRLDSILLYTFIEEFLNSPYAEYVTNEDYDLIQRVLYKLYGRCLIPYPDYKKSISLIKSKQIPQYRISSDCINRSVSTGNIRVIS